MENKTVDLIGKLKLDFSTLLYMIFIESWKEWIENVILKNASSPNLLILIFVSF